MNDLPLLIEFVAGTKIYREPETVPQLPIVQNGPPGTFVIFTDGRKVPLPTDQIVFAEDTGGRARIGFGGMSFEGMEERYLVFYRVRVAAAFDSGRGRVRAAPHRRGGRGDAARYGRLRDSHLTGTSAPRR